MPDKNINFDREDNEAIGDATRRQWDAISHVLHLSALDRLADNAEQLQVTNRIVDLVNRTRGGAINTAQLTGQLNTQFTEERNARAPATPEGTSARTMEQQQLAIAESWLQVIYRNVERKDITQLIADMPASIRPIDSPAGNNEWVSYGVTISTTPPVVTRITVDLQNPIWRSGSNQEIRARLDGKTLAQAGIVTRPVVDISHTLNAADIDEIFKSKTNVVDPLLPLANTNLTAVPLVGGGNATVSVDLPRLFRDYPDTPGMDRAALQAHIAGLYPADINNILSSTGIDIATQITPAAITGRIFATLGRSITQSLASSESTLTAAIDSRQPIDSLLESTADNRELLLALSVFQQDPTTREALKGGAVQTLLNKARKLESERDLKAALTTLQDPTTKSPSPEPTRTLVWLSGQIDGIRTATPPVGTRDLSGWAKKMKQDADALQAERDNLEKVISAVGQVQSYRAKGITLGGTTTYIDVFSDPSVADVQVAVLAAGNQFDASRFAREVIESFNHPDSTGDKNPRLRDATFYDAELKKTEDKIEEEKGKSQAGGSEAVWAIVRRGLENQGVRAEQLEKTIQYMKNQLDHTPESARDIGELTNSVYDYVGERERGQGLRGLLGKGADGEPTPTAEWQQDKSYRTLKTLGLWKHKPSLVQYQNRLFSARGIGLTREQINTSMSRSVPLPRLIDAYFRTKYLTELPDSDPRRLPDDSQEMVEMLRRMHTAILERSQLSFHNSTAATEAEMEKMGIKKDMTKLERLQAAQSYLLNEKDSYFAQNSATMEKIIDRAYRPIRIRQEKHDKWKAAWAGKGPWYNPAGWPVNGTKFIGGQAKALVTGNGSPYNPVTYPARVVKGTTSGLINFLKMEV
ncbi:hypothetical protein COU75_03235 [Candidatus Peregrinibacteria bacterium CG10_big_fil_rev_8_21_14_0_10_42_8]|nr:MAG: hypothetical protein COU75_03235 [Candidatus Peregrinibacteria bacterium CG10_big_fil_rev_8_21_14_0_10_42_8]